MYFDIFLRSYFVLPYLLFALLWYDIFFSKFILFYSLVNCILCIFFFPVAKLEFCQAYLTKSTIKFNIHILSSQIITDLRILQLLIPAENGVYPDFSLPCIYFLTTQIKHYHFFIQTKLLTFILYMPKSINFF